MKLRQATPGLEMRVTPDRKSDLHTTISDCLYIAQTCKIMVLAYQNGVDMVIPPHGDSDILYNFYSKRMIKNAMDRAA